MTSTNLTHTSRKVLSSTRKKRKKALYSYGQGEKFISLNGTMVLPQDKGWFHGRDKAITLYLPSAVVLES